ncbi:MAG: hypothetical protein AAF645_29905, partial [Myxococcota bacterium]
MASTSEPGDHGAAPGLPEIQDEAAKTPMWVPALGLGIFMALALWLIVGTVIDQANADAAASEAAEA